MSIREALKDIYETEEEFLKGRSYNDHLSRVEQINSDFNIELPKIYSIQESENSTVKVYTIGWNNRAIVDVYLAEAEDETNYRKLIIDSLKEMPVYELSSNRIELEHLIECNFYHYLNHCKKIRDKLLVKLYIYTLKESGYNYSELLKFTKDVIEELYHSRTFSLEVANQIHEMYGMSDAVHRLAVTFKEIENFYGRDILNEATKLTRRHYFIQEVIINKVLATKNLNEFKRGMQIAKRDLAQRLTTPRGKIEYIMEVATKKDITQEEALAIVNKQSLKLIGTTVYKNYDSYRASKSSHNNKKS